MALWNTTKKNMLIESLISRFQSGEIDEQQIEQGFDDLGVQSSDIPALRDKPKYPKTIRKEWTPLGRRLIGEHVYNTTYRMKINDC
jgi:hypothetical protein